MLQVGQVKRILAAVLVLALCPGLVPGPQPDWAMAAETPVVEHIEESSSISVTVDGDAELSVPAAIPWVISDPSSDLPPPPGESGGTWPTGYSLAATLADSSPAAGENNIVALRLQNAEGSLFDQFTGYVSVTVSGVQPSPDGSYGSFAGNTLSPVSSLPPGQTVHIPFVSGVASVPLVVNAAASQQISLTVAEADPVGTVLALSSTSGAPASMIVAQDIGAPQVADGYFSPQPIIHVVDAFGNICAEQETNTSGEVIISGPNFLITAAKYDQGGWELDPDSTCVGVSGGIVPFVGLKANSQTGVSDAQIIFSCPGIPPVVSGKVSIPGGSTQPPRPRLSIVQDIGPELTAEGQFVRQPIIEVLDGAGHRMTEDNSTIVSIYRAGLVDGALSGNPMVRVSLGLATFTDCGLQDSAAVGAVTLYYFDPAGNTHPVLGSTIELANSGGAGLDLCIAPNATSATAGAGVELTLSVCDADGQLVSDFSGQQSVVIGGVAAAPDGSFGSLGETALTAAAINEQICPLQFAHGLAATTLRLHAVGDQVLSLRIPGVTDRAHCSIAIASGEQVGLRILEDIVSPAAYGQPFAEQPSVIIHDRFGNGCSLDSSTQVTVVKADSGLWTLAGTLTRTAINGVATFDDLWPINAEPVSGVRLRFSAPGLAGTTSREVTLPDYALTAAAYDSSFISAGAQHSLAVRSDGLVLAWGAGWYGQLGDGTYGRSLRPEIVRGLSRIRSVAAGGTHSLALRADGKVFAWGDNAQGQLGVGLGKRHTALPEAIANLQDVVGIAAGKAHSVALLSNGTVATWGDGQYGQLGNGTTSPAPTPTVVQGLGDVQAIAAGATHTVVLRRDGTVWTFGDNQYGQLGDGGTNASSSPTPVSGLEGVQITAVAAGDGYTLALAEDGTVLSWGRNDYGQLGNGTQGDSAAPTVVSTPANSGEVEAIAAGTSHGIALLSDGAVLAWGRGQLAESSSGPVLDTCLPLCVPNLEDAIAVAAGGTHTLALEESTQIVSWGGGDEGQLGNGVLYACPVPMYTFVFLAGRPSSVVVSSPNLTPIAGQPTRLDFTVLDEAGQPCANYDGVRSIAVGGVCQALDDSYGSFDGRAITSSFESFLTDFVDGCASIELCLNQAGQQDLYFSLGNVEYPNADIQIDPQPGQPHWLVLVSDIEAPPASGWRFTEPPILFMLDAYYNLCLQDNSTVATASKAGDGSWQLTGTTSVEAQIGVFVFADLWVEGASPGTPLSLSIQVPGFDPLVTSGGTIPAQFVSQAFASSSNTCPIVGAEGELFLAMADANMYSDPAYSGQKDVTVSGVIAAPDGSYGSLGGTTFTAAAETGQTIPLAFVDGYTRVPLVLHSAEEQRISFYLAGAARPVSVLFSPTIGAPDHMVLLQDIQAPVVSGGIFASQPAVAITDAYGNICRGLESGQVSVVAQGGGWTLTGTSAVSVRSGKAEFLDLGAVISGDGRTAQMAFSLDGFDAISSQTVPLPQPGELAIADAAIAAGEDHCLALSRAGLVYTWGKNEFGQLGNGTTADSEQPQLVPGLEGVISVVAGDGFSLALSADGKVHAWGRNNAGQLGKGPGSGSLYPNEIPDLSGVKAIAAGHAHGVALQHDGTVVTWGDNSQGQLAGGFPYGLTNCLPSPVFDYSEGVSAVAAGREHTVALLSDGHVVAWGGNEDGQLGDRSNQRSNEPVLVPSFTDVVAISAGETHTMAVTRDGTLYTWGSNRDGQLGDSGWHDTSYPAQVPHLQFVEAISASSHSLAVQDGTVYSWGDNWYGQLGLDPRLSSNQPLPVSGVQNAVDVAAGGRHTLVLTDDGTVYSCGTTVGDTEYQLVGRDLQLNRILGDCNADDKVDIIDLAMVACEYGWRGSDPNVADLNADGCIDLFDLVSVARFLLQQPELPTFAASGVEPVQGGYCQETSLSSLESMKGTVVEDADLQRYYLDLLRLQPVIFGTQPGASVGESLR